MSTNTTTTRDPLSDDFDEAAHLDVQIGQAEGELAVLERELARVTRSGGGANVHALRSVEQAEERLNSLKSRRERHRIGERMKAEEAERAQEAQKAHKAAERANAQKVKAERKQLADSAQKAAQSVQDAVSAVRTAVSQVRAHSDAVEASAGRLEGLGLPLSDDWNAYEAGGKTERGKAAVRVDGETFGTVDAREIRLILKWADSQVNRAEFFGKDSGGIYLHNVDSAVRSRLLGE